MNKVIGLRLDEIIANIKEQIFLSGYEGQLGAGLIITGGASQLRNLDLYLTQKLKMPVRKATAKKTFINNAPDLISDPAYTQALGMLMFANENCELPVKEATEEKREETRESSSGWFRGKVLVKRVRIVIENPKRRDNREDSLPSLKRFLAVCLQKRRTKKERKDKE